MTKQSWTAGPYTIITEPEHFEILADDGAITVAKVYRETDAYLIALAPEMAEALRLCAVRLEDLAVAAPESERSTDAAAATVRAILAKLEGGQ